MKVVRKVEGKRIDLVLYEAQKAIPEKHYVDALYYNIVLKSGEKIGEISAKLGMNDVMYLIGNVGYSIIEPYRGNGYAGEAVELIEEVFIKNGMRKILITNDPNNHASRRVCEKLGARFIEAARVPKDHVLWIEQGHEYENIWELKF